MSVGSSCPKWGSVVLDDMSSAMHTHGVLISRPNWKTMPPAPYLNSPLSHHYPVTEQTGHCTIRVSWLNSVGVRTYHLQYWKPTSTLDIFGHPVWSQTSTCLWSILQWETRCNSHAIFVVAKLKTKYSPMRFNPGVMSASQSLHVFTIIPNIYSLWSYTKKSNE